MSATQTLGGPGRGQARPLAYNPLPPSRSRIGARRRFPCLRMEDQVSYQLAGSLSIWRTLVVWWTPRAKEVVAKLEYKAGKPVGWVEEGGSFSNIWQAFPPHINTTAKVKAWLWKRRQKEIETKITQYQKELEKMKGVKLDGNY